MMFLETPLGVVRIWRLPPLSGLDDGQDRRAGVRLQRVPDPDQMGKIGIDWTIFAINCTGFRTALP
jgi:hypothetical protein